MSTMMESCFKICLRLFLIVTLPFIFAIYMFGLCIAIIFGAVFHIFLFCEWIVRGNVQYSMNYIDRNEGSVGIIIDKIITKYETVWKYAMNQLPTPIHITPQVSENVSKNSVDNERESDSDSGV